MELVAVIRYTTHCPGVPLMAVSTNVPSAVPSQLASMACVFTSFKPSTFVVFVTGATVGVVVPVTFAGIKVIVLVSELPTAAPVVTTS